jgi:hypothetical protein
VVRALGTHGTLVKTLTFLFIVVKAICSEMRHLENPGSSLSLVVNELSIANLLQTVNVFVEQRTTCDRGVALLISSTGPGVLNPEGRWHVKSFASGRLDGFLGIDSNLAKPNIHNIGEKVVQINGSQINRAVESDRSTVLTSNGEVDDLSELVATQSAKLGTRRLHPVLTRPWVTARDERKALNGSTVGCLRCAFGDNSKLSADRLRLRTVGSAGGIETVEATALAHRAKEAKLLSRRFGALSFNANKVSPVEPVGVRVEADLFLQLVGRLSSIFSVGEKRGRGSASRGR